jgi:hypothetical protein
MGASEPESAVLAASVPRFLLALKRLQASLFLGLPFLLRNGGIVVVLSLPGALCAGRGKYKPYKEK